MDIAEGLTYERCGPAHQIIKVYIEALTGLHHVISPDGHNNAILSQGRVLGTAPTMRTAAKCIFQGQGVRGEGPLTAQV